MQETKYGTNKKIKIDNGQMKLGIINTEKWILRPWYILSNKCSNGWCVQRRVINPYWWWYNILNIFKYLYIQIIY